MGNRAYITLREKTYYVHWNGGLDTWCPLIDAINATAKKLGLPTNEDIEAAFKLFCESDMELLKDMSPYHAAKQIEENGHYFLRLVGDSIQAVHRFEKYNESTEMDDILSAVIINPRDYFLVNYLPQVTEDYKAKAREEYPARFQVFKEIFERLSVPRLEAKARHDAKMKEDSKKTFKKLILDDIKARGLDHIAKKVTSIKYKSFSGGDSVDVSIKNAWKSERETLKNLLDEYHDGHFNGMIDCYEYKETNKARTAKYVHYQNEFSPEHYEAAQKYLLDEYGIQKGDDDRASEVLGRWYNESVRKVLWDAESLQDLQVNRDSHSNQAGA